MARKDRNTDESYAQDVFDNPPQGPIGVRRGHRASAARVVRCRIGGLVAAGAGGGAGSAAASPAEYTSSPASSSSANLSTQVRVVNGTRKTGYAAKQAAVLTGAGYTNVVAANPSGSLPSASVVWYQNESDLATAQDVAAKLGISNVSKVTNLSAPVVVVLMN